MRAHRLVFRFALTLLMATCASTVHGGEVRWKGTEFSYTAKGKKLEEFLREFGASQGLMVVVDKQVQGTVNGKFKLLPGSLMDLMAASYGFIWYAEGNVLYVSPASDVRSELIRLSTANVARLRQALEQLDIPDRRFPIVYDSRHNTALVSGPSRYVDLVAQTARSVDRNDNVVGSTAVVRVFPLRYAWAGDLTYTQGGRDQTIPGVASVLSQVYGASPVRTLAAPASPSRSSPLDALYGLGLSGQAPGSAYRGRASVFDADTRAPAAQSSSPGDTLPQFTADGRMNAVIVRDAPERMKDHETAVKSLDVKPGLVEIEVRIIEVNSDALEALGFDWRLRTGRVDLQVGRGSLPTLSWGTALADGAPTIGPNGAQTLSPSPSVVLTTVLGDAGRFLIARVNALAQEGRANMLASPKIMTLDNVEAVMEDISTFFVRVAGNLDVDLFDVSVGTSLRVTPLIVTEGDQQKVKMAIRIEDGVLTGQAVDQIPVVRRSTITTQSLIADGEALLIAGYSQESDTSDEAGVPGLSALPGVGRLFKYTEKRKSRVERFFLLTPKVAAL
ncbi:MAG: type III secretion system outer membrane ring subunit SctC [Methylibium sp.]|uniref:type III secretion system outer membrane ring subunit SctC n=1 Tax=Methylibium sp. TaxID=2067992 RepID=UPI0017F54023|nr:type III secretion system outer membrane ring subunit SctC [Methylibium sp.]MBA3596414.1 type III secretion system outer membrane ring subunit SctC [Methylibium sp.]